MKRTPTRGVVNSGGVEFSYLREGSGEPLVIVGTATYYPRAFSARLREEYELLFIDSRHFVPSYRPSQDETAAVSFDTLADDLEAVRVHLGIDEWIVLGHSFHAQIALAYANKYPARTTRLVLVAGVPFSFAELGRLAESFWDENAPEERKRQHLANRKAIEDVLSATAAGRRFAVNYVGDAAKYWVDSTYDARWLWEGVESSPVFEPLVAKLPSQDEVRSMLQSLEMPTLVILGKLDFAIPYTAWESVIDDLRNLDHVLLKEDSHNPQTEFPERFDTALIEWLRK
jgi:proline iminopeptidase